MPKVTFILPTINELDNLKILIPQILLLDFFEKEILVVDDSPSDETREYIEKSYDENFVFFISGERKGLLSAIKKGISKASGEIIVWMDADLSHPAGVTLQMYKLIENGCDLVSASRYLPGSIDENVRGGLVVGVHKMLTRFLNFSCRKLFLKNCSDFTSGFLMIRSSVLKTLKFSGGYGEYYMELLYCANKNLYKIKEVPYHSPKRIFGISKTANSLSDLIFIGYPYLQKLIRLTIEKARS